MEQNSTSARFHALDGIRGLAILLVVLNHVNSGYISSAMPSWLDQIIFNSGVTGVSLLFVLSGFLMTYIYPNPQSGLHFLQKRYTRIFPLFLTSVAIMLVLRELPNLAWYWRLGIFLVFPFLSYSLWVYIIKRYASTNIKKYIFLGFILLQILVGAFYLFWVMRHPAIVFNQQIPAVIREGTIGLVNGTLTLPLGDYIPMLEGVYWSLVSEVLFYILYPFVCVPLIHYFIPKKRWVKFAVVAALIPFFIGMDILSHKIFVLSMLQLPICYYFVAGIVLGYLYKHHEGFINKVHNLFPGTFSFLTVLLFICVVVLKLFVLNAVYPSYISLTHILWAFPIAFVMALALDQQTLLSKILSSRVLVFLGTISYSIYLSHTPVLHMVEDSFQATNVLTNIMQMILTFSITILLSVVWYQWLEKPYFKRNKEKEIVPEFHHNRVSVFIRRPAFLFSAICCLYIIAVFSAYQSNFNFFSIQTPFKNIMYTNPKISSKTDSISMKEYPKVDFQITSDQNNLEIITAHITHLQTIKNSVNIPQWLVFHMKEAGQKDWYATNTYTLSYISDSLAHPFGFPLIIDAKGKSYLVELSMSSPTSRQYISLDAKSIEGVYKVDKVQLIKHPAELADFILARIATVFRNQEAQLTFYLFLPLVLLLIISSFPKGKAA